MTTARSIIGGALTFRLNRLSPGETLDADVASVCLDALNQIADEWNGAKSFLFREVLTTSSAITGASGTLGSTWAGIEPGDDIISATVQYSTGLDVVLSKLTMKQYQEIAIKNISSIPANFAYDGQSTVYLFPKATGQTITIRTKQIVSDFADLDTDYVMPKGYKSALTDVLAERIAPPLVGGIPPAVAMAAKAARTRILGQSVVPAIISGNPTAGGVVRIMRGY
jgi:hypothetical protein